MVDSRNLWLFFAFLSALFAALTTILAKLGVQGVSSNLATAVRTIVILLIAWGWVAATGEIHQLGEVNRVTLLFLVLSGVATGLSWLFYFRALQSGPTAIVAAIDKSSLALVLILSALVLHEAMTWKTVLGVLCVVAGILIATL
ncbi:EamA family transporter [Caldilinea sp.]|uniref:EamA family transporter n=1 Tax=Caldilinea sp. TaxID=2293560 RepID=UPI0026137181|nr:EamA family transporter [uncultured Caldilinea sp.]